MRWGVHLPLRLWTDSSAAMGTAGRQGLGKLRHLDCHKVWLQHRLKRKDFELRKAPGERNPADVFTKHIESSPKLKQLMSLFNCEFRAGRSAAAPKLKKNDGKVKGDIGLGLTAAAVASERLPHQQPRQVLERDHPAAIPWPEVYVEEFDRAGARLSDPLQALARTERKARSESMTTTGALTVVTESAPFVVDHIHARAMGSTACVKHTPEVSTCVRPGPPPLGGVGGEWIQAGPWRTSPFHRPPVACVARAQ